MEGIPLLMVKIKKIIYNSVTSGRGDILDFPVKSKVILINILLIILFFVFIFFSFLNYFQCNFLLMAVDLFSLFLVIIFFILLRTTFMLDIVSYIITLAFSLVLIFFLISGGKDNLGLLYFLIYPAPVFFILGKRKGTIVISIFTLTAVCSYLIFMNYSWFPDYSSSALIRYILTYIFILIFAYCYEHVISKTNSELEKANIWLIDSEEKYRSLVENANIGILIAKSDRVVFANSFFSRMSGYSSKSLEGKEIADLLNRENFENAKGLLRNADTNHETPEYIESTIRTREGKHIDVDMNVLTIHLQKEPALLVIINDISKKKTSEKEKEKLITELNEFLDIKNRFISVLAHDLKGPLGSYFEFMEFFEENFDDMTDEEKKDIINSLKVSSKNNYDLLLNLLNWVRMQDNKIQFNPEIISIKEIVSETSEFYRIEADRKDIKIISNISPKLYAFGDTDMVNIIMRNLVSNAIKYSYDGGSIRIIASEANDFVEIQVSDNGKGIKSDMLADIFNLNIYSRGKAGSGKMSTGLGLILCREMVEKNGGQIWVESTEGKGTSITFTLPGDYNETA
jgi:PAS domain S-box-containing protein